MGEGVKYSEDDPYEAKNILKMNRFFSISNFSGHCNAYEQTSNVLF